MADQTPKGVVALVQSNVSTRKSRLLLAATELFVAGASPNSMECNVFAELFRQYIGETPLEERRRIASLLARCDFAPHDTVLTLMRDPDISVAHRVVAYSTALTPCDLVAVVGRGPEELRRAVALRADLTDEVRTALELNADTETLAILAEAGARPAAAAEAARIDLMQSEAAPSRAAEPQAAAPAPAEKAAVASLDDDALTAALDDALRPLIAESPDTSAFESREAGAEAARAAAPMTPQALKQILAEQVSAVTGGAAREPSAPSPRMRPGNLAFLKADSETRARMISQAQAKVLAEVASGGARARVEPDQGMLRCLEQAAMAHDRESFLALLSGMLDVDATTAERIMLDPYGEPLAVALASLGMSTSRTTGVMIQVSPAVPDVDRLRAIAALRSNLDPRAARLIARDWRQVADEAATPTAQHQPLLDASERTRRTGGIDQRAAAETRKRGNADVLVLRDVAT